jgi:large subunit ribosomal protein L28
MQKCDVTGKGKQYGHNVSFSLRRTNKVWKPNLQKKTVVVDGKKVKMKLSASAIRTLKKQGLLGNKKPATADSKQSA